MKSATSTADTGTTRTADRLLLLLKTRAGLTTRALAESLEISVPAVRQHLRSLADLVVCETVNQGVGRPAQIWHLSPAGQARFPDTHAELTVRLIGFIEAGLGAGAMEQVLDRAYQHNLAAYRKRLSPARSLGERVRRLAAVRAEEGYMAEARYAAGSWTLVEHHCPICAAADACRGFCRNELDLFRTVLGPDVEVTRTEYLFDGGERCAYRISRRR